MRKNPGAKPNVLFVKKNGNYSKVRDFFGIHLTYSLDWLYMIFCFFSPYVSLILLLFTQSKVAPIVLTALQPIFISAMVFNSYFLQQYVFSRKRDAKDPDKKGLVFAIFALNWYVVWLFNQTLPHEKRHVHWFTTPVSKKEKNRKRNDAFGIAEFKKNQQRATLPTLKGKTLESNELFTPKADSFWK